MLLDEPPEEEDGLRGGAPPATAPAAAQVRGRRGGGARGAGRVMRVGMSGAEAWPRSGGGAQVGRAGEARAARPFNFPRLVRARPLCPVVTAPPATLRMTEPSAPPPLARVWDGGRSSRRWEPRAVAFQRRGGNCLPSGRDPGPGPGPSVQRRARRAGLDSPARPGLEEGTGPPARSGASGDCSARAECAKYLFR